MYNNIHYTAVKSYFSRTIAIKNRLTIHISSYSQLVGYGSIVFIQKDSAVLKNNCKSDCLKM